MKLKAATLKNFRCYEDEITIELSDLTTFIGKNDIGKSSVLEALEIFFNNDVVSIEQGDANIRSGCTKVEVTCEFTDFPAALTLDAGAETSLAEEFLLTDAGSLKIRKVFDCGSKKPPVEVFVVANHPTAAGFNNLLELKEKDLQARVKEMGLDAALKGNPGMRKAIWAAAGDLELTETAIPVSKAKEDTKRIWEQIESYLPLFALFQSDRSSRDSDDEVQNPMKAAVAAAIAEVQDDIARIQKRVQEKAEEIAKSTLEALKSIDENLASELTPEFTPPTPSKWSGLFSVGLNTDSGIPLNKRGSGVRRLVLVSFFKAEAERRLKNSNRRSIIYAIEEPETAQHPNNQRILIESFKSLAGEPLRRPPLARQSASTLQRHPHGLRAARRRRNDNHMAPSARRSDRGAAEANSSPMLAGNADHGEPAGFVRLDDRLRRQIGGRKYVGSRSAPRNQPNTLYRRLKRGKSQQLVSLRAD